MSSDAYQYQAAKLKEIKNTLQSVVDNFQEHPEQIAEMLAFKSQFYNYSINNTVLIFQQNPSATYVASFQDWKKKGYHVLRGQHGMKVLFPIRTELIEVGEKNGKKQYRRVADATPEEKRRISLGQLKPIAFTRFGIGTVFDISQTDCPPEKYPEFFHMGYSSEQHAQLYQAVKSYAEQKGFPVQEADLQSISLRGDFTPITKEIRINDRLNDTEKLSTLTHELGHALMHSDPKARLLPAEVREMEADCISIMLQQYVGVDLTDLRKRHFVQNYEACKEVQDFKIEDVLKNVNLTYSSLHRELEPVFDRLVSDKVQETQTEEKAQEKSNEFILKGFEADEIAYYANFTYDGKEYRQAICEQAGQIYVSTGTHERVRHDFTPEQAQLYLAFERERQEQKCLQEAKPKVKYMENADSNKHQQTHPEKKEYKEQDAAVLDHIKYGVSILTLASDMGFTPKQIGGYYTLKEHDSVRIYPETNSFNQFSSGVGGSTIDFAMNFGGYNKQDAIRMLKERYAGNMISSLTAAPEPQKKSKPAPERKKFELPEKTDGKYARVYAYLTKTRCLDPEIVRQCIKDGLVYEDVKHNAVFIGKDGDGNPAFATRRSTLSKSNFKRDVAGSRQDLGFYVDNHSEKLYICEAPIDALSIMSLMKQQGKPVEHASYLAICGTGKDKALYTRLRENPQIREVVLANDRDTAGWKANKKIIERLSKDFPQIQVSRLDPKQGKDINDYLRARAKSPNPKSRGMEVER